MVCSSIDRDRARQKVPLWDRPSLRTRVFCPAFQSPTHRTFLLGKSYTITAEVDVPDGGGDGMIVTNGGRFGEYGL
jgi:hypothetical protein